MIYIYIYIYISALRLAPDTEIDTFRNHPFRWRPVFPLRFVDKRSVGRWPTLKTCAKAHVFIPFV